MPSSCAAAHCDHKYTQTANVSFHKFPLHKPHILQKWIAFADRDPAWQPSRWSSICSRHFLSSDFRGHSFQKKYLKPLAIPTVTIKKLEFNTLDFDINDNCHFAIDDQADRTHDQLCRLCARVESIEDTPSTPSVSSSIDDPLTASNIAKCLPTIIRLDASDQFPKKVCAECLTKIQQFSLFVDIVADVQSYFLAKPFGSRDEQSTAMTRQTGITFSNSVVAIKPVIIKQEPIVKVKQEVLDSFRTGLVAHEQASAKAAVVPVDLFPENDAFCEFCDVYFINNVELKNHIVYYHSDNSREVPNNCEIMEIITLENAFVDLADNCADDEYDHHIIDQATDHSETNYYVPLEHVLKVEHLNDYEHREQLRLLNAAIQNDHSYAQISSNGVFMPLNECGLKQEPSTALQQLTDTSFKVFESSTSDDQRLDNVYDEKKSNSKNTRACSICSIKFKSVYHLLLHNKKHRRPEVRRSLKNRQCYDCRATFTSKLALKNHKRLLCHVRKSLTCSVCQTSFHKLVLLRIHMKRCPKRHGSADGVMVLDQQPFHSEEVIHFETEATSTINKVLQRFTKSITSEIVAVRPLQNGRYACDQCNRSYGRRSNLYRHQAYHRPRDQWTHKCPGCNVMFDREYDLRMHIRHHHCAFVPGDHPKIVVGTAKSFVCQVCGVQFKTGHKLRNHELVHSGAKPFVCESCGKRFRFRNNLYQHKLTHLNERKHKCPLCTKIFKRLAGLNQHVRGFHYKIKPHECPVCKYSYALKGDMARCKHSILKMQII